MSSKIYINEDIGYVEAWEALAHLTDDWICGGNVSNETVMNMRDVIEELRSELAEYVELHSKVADEFGTANHKLMPLYYDWYTAIQYRHTTEKAKNCLQGSRPLLLRNQLPRRSPLAWTYLTRETWLS